MAKITEKHSALSKVAKYTFEENKPKAFERKNTTESSYRVYEDGKVLAVIATQNWAVGIADYSVDGHNPDNVRRVELKPFCDEDSTLTYFRAPNIEEDVVDEDEIFAR